MRFVRLITLILLVILINAHHLVLFANHDGVWLFFSVNEGESWSDDCYAISFTDTISFTKTGAGGNKFLLKYDVVTISQGVFLVAYCASHMGNGDLEFFPIGDLKAARYSISAIDGHFEWTEETAIAFGYSNFYGEGKFASLIYKDGILAYSFGDINNDGYDDVILSGTAQLYLETEEGASELVEEFPCEYVYVYDIMNDNFVLRE